MTYAIDTEGTGGVGSTLRTTSADLRECATDFAYAGGLARRGVATDHPALAGAVDEFVTTHLSVISTIASASGGLARDLTRAALSAQQVELATAADFGLRAVGVRPDPAVAGVS